MLLSLLWFGDIHWSGPVTVRNPGSYLVAPRDDSHMSLLGPKEQYVGINKRIVTDQCRPWARTGRVTKIALMFQGQGPHDELAVTHMNLMLSPRPSRATCTSYYITGPAEKNVHLTLGRKKGREEKRCDLEGPTICSGEGAWPGHLRHLHRILAVSRVPYKSVFSSKNIGLIAVTSHHILLSQDGNGMSVNTVQTWGIQAVQAVFKRSRNQQSRSHTHFIGCCQFVL
jgi:hypothetical protein